MYTFAFFAYIYNQPVSIPVGELTLFWLVNGWKQNNANWYTECWAEMAGGNLSGVSSAISQLASKKLNNLIIKSTIIIIIQDMTKILLIKSSNL